MDKMCGNCGKRDHRYVDCPVIDLQFPPSKLDYNTMKAKAEKWDMLSDPTTKNIAFQLSQWKEKAILNESKSKDFDDLFKEYTKLKKIMEKIQQEIDKKPKTYISATFLQELLTTKDWKC